MLLIRHALTAWNTAGIKFGRTDVPLSGEGRSTAGEYLLPMDVTSIYTSPLARAHQTAAIIAHRFSMAAPTVLQCLIERDHGAAEGWTEADRDARYGSKADVPGRESDDMILARTFELLALLPERSMLVTHSGVILALTGQKVGHLETVEWTP